MIVMVGGIGGDGYRRRGARYYVVVVMHGIIELTPSLTSYI